MRGLGSAAGGADLGNEDPMTNKYPVVTGLRGAAYGVSVVAYVTARDRLFSSLNGDHR